MITAPANRMCAMCGAAGVGATRYTVQDLLLCWACRDDYSYRVWVLAGKPGAKDTTHHAKGKCYCVMCRAQREIQMAGRAIRD